MNDYTPEQIKDMATFLSMHPEMVPAELKAQPVEEPATVGAPATQNIASVTKNTQDRIAQLEEELKNERKATVYAMTSGIQSALERQELEIRTKANEEHEKTQVINDLYSVMPKKLADQLLKDNLPIQSLRSVIESMKGSGAARVGVATGIEMRSTVQVRDRMTALGIPSIEFTNGGN